MDLKQFPPLPLMTVDGERVTGSDVIVRRSLVILVDAGRARAERTAAEIGWVRERLDPSIDLILIWPARALGQARAFLAGGKVRVYFDSLGEFRRLVSPTGQRRAVLIEPELWTMTPVSAASPIFAIGHGVDGADRTIDLGDVYH